MFPALEKFVESQKWLDSVGDPLQQYINSLFSNAGPSGKQLKNFLNGTWLGHPLHPMLTDVPVGAWTCTFLLDVVGSAKDDEALHAAADLTLTTGLLAAAGSAASGFTDWSDTYGKERNVGLLHGVAMLTTFGVYLLSLLLRLGGARKTGARLGYLGYGLLAAGAYVGGDEVFDIGYGVNHTAFDHLPDKFVTVMKETDLPADTPTKAEAGGVPVLLVKRDEHIYALHDTCVHAGCSLSGGKLDGRGIICPCHGSHFDLLDGSVIDGPATMPEPHFEVRVREGEIEVKGA